MITINETQTAHNIHNSTSPRKWENTSSTNETAETTDEQSAITHDVFGYDNTKGALRGWAPCGFFLCCFV